MLCLPLLWAALLLLLLLPLLFLYVFVARCRCHCHSFVCKCVALVTFSINFNLIFIELLRLLSMPTAPGPSHSPMYTSRIICTAHYVPTITFIPASVLDNAAAAPYCTANGRKWYFRSKSPALMRSLCHYTLLLFL